MLKVWNMVLIIMTFCLTIFGTFLTRSGVISSVHSFTQSGLGPYFMGFLWLVLTVSVSLLVCAAARSAASTRARLRTLARVGLPVQQPPAGRHRVRDFLGDGLPGALRMGARREDHRGPAVLQQVNAPLGIALLLPDGGRPDHRVATLDVRQAHGDLRGARWIRCRRRSRSRGSRDALADGGDRRFSLCVRASNDFL